MTATLKKLEGIQAVVFGAYGTLFDAAQPLLKHEQAFNGQATVVASLWRAKQLEYSWVRSLTGVHADFWHVSRAALDFTLESLNIADVALADELMQGLLQLDAFAGVAPVLQALRSKPRRLALLSNGAPAMLEAILTRAELKNSFEQILSVEEIGVYKPSRRAYRLAMQKLHIHDAPSVCYVSANGWDAYAAAQFGFQTLWLKRGSGPDERLPGKLAGTLERLEQVLDLV